MKNLIVCCLAVSLFACKPSRDTPAASTPATESPVAVKTLSKDTTASSAPATAKDSTMRFIVSFYSIGSGAEQNLAAKFKTFADTYLKAGNGKINYAEVHWGREGETDYCLSLNELIPAMQLDFIIKSKELLKEAKYVHYFENKECMKRR